MANNSNEIVSSEFVLINKKLTETIDFFTDQFAFQLEMIYPADNPTTAVISGHGIRIRFDKNGSTDGKIRLIWSKKKQEQLTAPNGTKIELVPELQLELPENIQSYVHTKYNDDSSWITGRAGMQYRDLIPGRQNGRFIASHIKIEDGGPVPDYTHYHNIRFQLIYCYKGWVNVVYEDQGKPIKMKAGDCFLQPPLIRHQVLESSDGLEVIEIGCPAEHETFTDPKMTLANSRINTDRDFSGQQFVYHNVDKANWKSWRISGFLSRDLGIAEATKGLLAVYVIKVSDFKKTESLKHNEEFLFFFVLTGEMQLDIEEKGIQTFNTGDSLVIPENLYHSFHSCSNDLELLEVRLSAEFSNISH